MGNSRVLFSTTDWLINSTHPPLHHKQQSAMKCEEFAPSIDYKIAMIRASIVPDLNEINKPYGTMASMRDVTCVT